MTAYNKSIRGSGRLIHLVAVAGFLPFFSQASFVSSEWETVTCRASASLSALSSGTTSGVVRGRPDDSTTVAFTQAFCLKAPFLRSWFRMIWKRLLLRFYPGNSCRKRQKVVASCRVPYNNEKGACHKSALQEPHRLHYTCVTKEAP